MKCTKCKDKLWKQCCHECLECGNNCYECDELCILKNYIDRFRDAYKDRAQYLKCAMCNLYQHVTGFSFSTTKGQLYD